MPSKVCKNEDCAHAGEPQDISNFHEQSKCKDGHKTICIVCCKLIKQKIQYPRQESGTKVCTKCGKEKDVSEFGSNAGSSDGLQSWCRQDKKIDNKARAERNKKLNQNL